MHIETNRNGHNLLKLGRVFAISDTEHVVEIVKSLAPSSELILDFTDVHEFQDAAFPALFEAIEPFKKRVSFRGLTEHHARMLKYLGLLE